MFRLRPIPVLCARGKSCPMGALMCDAVRCDRIILRPVPTIITRLLPPEKGTNALRLVPALSYPKL